MTVSMIGLGGNLGNRREALREAKRRLARLGTIEAESSWFDTVPVGGADPQPRYLNAVVQLRTERSPRQLLHELLEIERTLGRHRSQSSSGDPAVARNAPRRIDLDLLLHGNCVIDSAELTLPHPRLHERWFVLAPLAEIAPDLEHPTLRRTISDLLDPVAAGRHRTGSASAGA